MPGLSTRTSDLATELELAARYADLRRELGWSNCTIDVEPGIDTGSVRFPAQILIRLIDEFSRAASGAATVRLQVRGDGCRVILLIDTGAHHAEHPVSRETELRLCDALYAIVGKAAEHRWIHAHPAAGGDHVSLLISLPGPSSTRVSFLPEEALS